MKTKRIQYEELTREGRKLKKEFDLSEVGSTQRAILKSQLVNSEGKIKKKFLVILTKVVNIKRKKKLRTHRL